MTALLALHLVVGLTCVSFGARLGRRALLVAAVAPAVTLVWLVATYGDVVDGRVRTEHVDWVPSLGLGIDLRLDGFAWLLCLVVASVGIAILVYGRWYVSARTPDVGRLAGLLALFAGAMVGLALADNLLLLYTCWELTSVASYLLIGNDHTEPRARAAALHALLVTSAGGLAMLGGFVVLAQEAGSYRLSDVLDVGLTGTATSIGLGLVLLGVFTKSAQYPFHGWLPGAMVAPTPVSAYLHAATMVKAGIYVLARFAPAFATVWFWRPAVVGVGLLTMVAGGLRALRQTDLKLLLAFGTVSQLGLLVVVFGVGTPEATAAGCVLLLAHAAFKATLFLVVGMLDHQTGTRDLRELPVLGPSWRPVVVVTLGAAASMAGVPALLGFIGKEAAYAALLDADFGGADVAAAGVVVGSVLTVAYSARFVWGAFLVPRRRSRVGRPRPVPPPAPGLLVPAAVLAAAGLVTGLAPWVLDPLVSAASASLDAASGAVHLAIWHGFNLPLLLSTLTLVAGIGGYVTRQPVARLLAVGRHLPSGSDAYLALLRGLNWLASRVTGVVQHGSLPIYVGVILLTAALLPVAALLLGGGWSGWPELVDTPAHLPVAVVLVVSAIAAAAQRRRISAVLFLGLTGYGMAALFVVQGAPDLALTQVAIETLSTILFVLVLRHLPARFERRSTSMRRSGRLAIAGAVGLAVFTFALVAGSARTEPPVSEAMVEQALPEGHGRNVVNVILVDFRGLDTLGEITVLSAAGIGAVALARAGRRPRPRPVEDGAEVVG